MMTTTSHTLPLALYRAEQTRELDRLAIREYKIPGYTLMCRAGEAALTTLNVHWPRARRIAVLCGSGNNGGDGFVIARLARRQGMHVDVIQMGDGNSLTGDALQAWREYENVGGTRVSFDSLLVEAADVIVDAMLGTGLERNVSGAWQQVIDTVNACTVPVLSVDIPSGLNSDTGAIMGVAIYADVTICFIGLKQGLFTASGPACCGEVIFNSLDIPDEIYLHVAPSATRISYEILKRLLWPRQRDSHKGDNGHVLVIGGNHGMAGAARLAGEAALRGGAGLVSVATRSANVTAIVSARPELMVHAMESAAELAPLLAKADIIAIGPGLGQDEWAMSLLSKVLESQCPLIVDADALNLLAHEPVQRGDWVLTPHPGEAARLVGTSADQIQQDRFSSLKQLISTYAAVVVLKGAGTLVSTHNSPVYICDAGNPGMGSGGMGDVLTGVIAALAAQGLDLEDAARVGVYAHSLAADRAAEVNGERGMIASDLLPHLRRLLNPE